MEPELSFPPGAAWIGSDHPFDLHEVYLRFRSPVWELAARPCPATLFITADSRYKLWVNGRFVHRGPARSYPETPAVDVLDVTEFCQPGANRLAVLVYQPGYSHFAYVHRGAAGLLAWLVCGDTLLTITNSEWRVRRDDSYAHWVPRMSIYVGGVEQRDLNKADSWMENAYDDTSWAMARLAAPVGSPPWGQPQPRQIPLLAERDLPMTLLETRKADNWNRKEGLHEEGVAGWLAANPVEMTSDNGGWFSPVLGAGEAAYWLADLGRDYTCQGWAEIKNAGGQEQVAVSYAEKMRDGRLILPDPLTYCRLRPTDGFTLRPGEQVVESFAMRGGRYLLWQVVGPTGPGFGFRPGVRVEEYPLGVVRPCPTDDPVLAAIMQMCENSIHACLQDGFVDCVWRESSQWLGDALPQSLTLWAMTGDVRPMRQILTMAAQGAYPDGILPSVVPSKVHAYVIPRYNFMWVELLHFYFQVTGDKALVATLWPTLQKLLATLTRSRDKTNLLISPPGRRFYIDWSPTTQNQPHAVYNLHMVLALQKAAQLADDLGLEDAEKWLAEADCLQAHIRAAFWRHGRWHDDLEQTTFSQLTAALALLTGTVRADESVLLLDEMVSRSLNLDDNHTPGQMVLASPFMHHYLFEALREYGRFADMRNIIRQRWGRWATAGYPTTWENWQVDFPDGSQCHAFSAHPRYHLGVMPVNSE